MVYGGSHSNTTFSMMAFFRKAHLSADGLNVFPVCRFDTTFDVPTPGSKRRSLLSVEEDKSPELIPGGRSLLSTSPVNYTAADGSYQDTFLPAAYQTADYFGVLTWAMTWGSTYEPASPLDTGCGTGNGMMRTEKADVLKMINVLDQSAPPAYSPGEKHFSKVLITRLSLTYQA